MGYDGRVGAGSGRGQQLTLSLVATLLAPFGCYGGVAASEDGGGSGSESDAQPTSDSSGTALTSSSGGEGGSGSEGESGGDATSGGGAGTEATDESSGTGPVDGENRAPEITDPGPQTIAEDQALDLQLALVDADGDPLRAWAVGLPPGAQWDEPARRLRFRPDFIQGGRSWVVTIVADDGALRSERAFTIAVDDTIQPPAPEVSKVEETDKYTRLTLTQKTDAYLDSPGNVGRSFVAYVSVPKSATLEAPAPVRISLHGFNGMPATSTSSNEFRIDPHDPQNTYWWGYDSALADAKPDTKPAGEVPDYTQRRVLHLLGWLLATYPGADPRRAYITGGSMGGAGAMQIGLWYARHFAYSNSQLGQAIPRNHRPGRIAQLQGLWGASDGPLWDALDLTRVLRDSPEARDQYLFMRHGKDDPTIHFGATVMASPLTTLSLYDALQELGVGHLAVWDEGAHGPEDPVLLANWWDEGFSPIHDPTSFLRADLAFPAFALSSADGDPGDGGGNGKRPWDVNAGYAGELAVPGDTGWNGAIAGALNRFLRWDATATLDTIDRLEMPLHVHDGEGEDPPKDGYPSRGDRFDGELPVVVDVTPRRLQAFRVRPGERVAWSFAAQQGEAVADANGSLRIPALALGLEWQTLVLTRVPQ